MASTSPFPALCHYYRESSRPLSAAERELAARKAAASRLTTMCSAILTIASIAAFVGLLISYPTTDFMQVIDTGPARVSLGLFLALPLWIYLLARSEKTRTSSQVLMKAPEIWTYELLPDWLALSKEESQPRWDADEAVLKLTGHEVDADPFGIPRRLDLIDERLYRMDGKPTREFQWARAV